MNISNSLCRFLNSIQWSYSEHIILHTLLYPVTLILKVFCQVSRLTIEYPNPGFNSSSLTFLVPIYASYRHTSYHTVLYIFQSSTFLTKCILLEICIVCLVSLPLLAVHIADFIFNIMIDDYSGTKSGSVLNNSLFSILKCSRAINPVHAEFY